jgi:hypothetical protein
MKMYFVVCFLVFHLTNCFGSIGNSEKEKIKSFTYLLQLLDSERISIEPQLFFYDDQGDSNLSTFEINSGTSNTQYTVKIISSRFEGEEMGFRINPFSKPFGYPIVRDGNFKKERSDSLSKTHTPYTIPLELPSDNPYSKNYNFAFNKIIDDFYIANSIDFTGDLYRFSLGKRTDIPTGIVSLTTFKWKRWDISFEVSNGTTKSYSIRLEGDTESISPRCKIEWKGGKENLYQLGVRFSSLFKDRFDNGVRLSILESIFALSTNSFIGELSNQLLYSQIRKNLQSTDSVWIQHICF